MHTAFASPVRFTDRHTIAAMPVEIDIHNRDDLVYSMLGLLASGHGELVVDMTETTFCDSSGVHALLRAHRRAQARGRKICVVAPHPNVRRVLDICGVGRVMPIHGDLTEAVPDRPKVA
ncbi:STAS domain-containing protein [Streptomonospora litoralis]|uniref:Anti-sigma factor antagonist n=1 Tax=Streptomonospora litoralis TaxID=2498135 RepID=A0A4P6QAS0_9ACTN|nr:STAS domain-containing protein [Streptomonospora litoralis]QBI56689.1 Anti-sigma-B factor antagonist [Streptomonospora litoralis]